MLDSTVVPGLGALHRGGAGQRVNEIVAVLRGCVAGDGRLGHLVGVLVALGVVLGQVGELVGVAVPRGGRLDDLGLGSRLGARARQRQRDLCGVVVLLAAVDPRLRARELSHAGQRVGEAFAARDRPCRRGSIPVDRALRDSVADGHSVGVLG